MNDTSSDDLITLPRAAKQLSISVRGLYRLIAQREIARPVKVGGASRLFESDLRDYKARLKAARKAH